MGSQRSWWAGVFLFFLSSSLVAQPAQITLTQYLKNYLQQDEAFLTSKVESDLAYQNQIQKSDLFQNELTLKPYWETSKVKIESPASSLTSQRSWGLSSQVTQKSPWGTQFQLAVDRSLHLDPLSADTPTTQGSITLSQELWKNHFGYSDRRRQEEAQLQWEASQLKIHEQMGQSCQKGATLYLSAYLQQEKKRLLTEALKQAENSQALTKKGYRQRLLRKLDLLSAQADFQSVQARSYEQDRLYQQSLHELLIQAKYDDKKNPTLQPPFEWIEKLPVSTFWEPKDNWALRAQEKEVQARHKAWLASKDSARAQINLGVEASHTHARTDVASTLVPTNEDKLLAFVKMDWPVWNPSLRAEVRSALNKKSLAELELRQQKKLKQQSHLQVADHLVLLKSLQESIKKQIHFHFQQVTEALKLLQVGRIEHMDYVYYRDLHLQAQTHLVEVQHELWLETIHGSSLSNQLSKICEVLL